jgi:hypothetical protein
MRQNAHWMTQQDDRILEYLEREGWATPSHIASEASIDISEGHIRDRLKMLWYAVLAVPVFNDMYEITTEGRLYLEGELDAGNQPTPTVERALRG